MRLTANSAYRLVIRLRDRIQDAIEPHLRGDHRRTWRFWVRLVSWRGDPFGAGQTINSFARKKLSLLRAVMWKKFLFWLGLIAALGLLIWNERVESYSQALTPLAAHVRETKENKARVEAVVPPQAEAAPPAPQDESAAAADPGGSNSPAVDGSTAAPARPDPSAAAKTSGPGTTQSAPVVQGLVPQWNGPGPWFDDPDGDWLRPKDLFEPGRRPSDPNALDALLEKACPEPNPNDPKVEEACRHEAANRLFPKVSDVVLLMALAIWAFGWAWAAKFRYVAHEMCAVPSSHAGDRRAVFKPEGEHFTVMGIAFTFVGLAVGLAKMPSGVSTSTVDMSLAEGSAVFTSSLSLGLLASLFGVILAVEARKVHARFVRVAGPTPPIQRGFSGGGSGGGGGSGSPSVPTVMAPGAASPGTSQPPPASATPPTAPLAPAPPTPPTPPGPPTPPTSPPPDMALLLNGIQAALREQTKHLVARLAPTTPPGPAPKPGRSSARQRNRPGGQAKTSTAPKPDSKPAAEKPTPKPASRKTPAEPSPGGRSNRRAAATGAPKKDPGE